MLWQATEIVDDNIVVCSIAMATVVAVEIFTGNEYKESASFF